MDFGNGQEKVSLGQRYNNFELEIHYIWNVLVEHLQCQTVVNMPHIYEKT